MNTAVKTLACAALIGLGGCATVVKGTTQDILVETDPTGASCTVSNSNGVQVAVLNQTPGAVQVSRSKHALTFSCTKTPQFTSPSIQVVQSDFNGMTFGNILVGGLIGAAVDASTGANNNYPEKVFINLSAGAPAEPLPAQPAATMAPTGTTTMQPVPDEEPSKKPKTP